MAEPAALAVAILTPGFLLPCVVLALLSGRRIGFPTPYGSLLTLFALGYWLIAVAFAMALVRPLLGIPPGTSLAPAALDLAGWSLQALGLALLVVRMGPTWQPRTMLLLVGIPLAFLALFLGVERGLEPQAFALGATYSVLNGLILALLLTSVVRFLRVAGEALGLLYLMLASAMLMKSIGDFVTYLGRGIQPDPYYALAGAIAALAWALHYRAVVRSPAPSRVFADPRLRPEQRILREIAREVRGLIGANGAGLVLNAAAGAFEARQIAHRVERDVIEAEAPPEVWRDAVERALAAAANELGEGVRGRLLHIVRVFGVDHRAPRAPSGGSVT